MTTHTNRQIVSRARELIYNSNNWTTGTYARFADDSTPDGPLTKDARKWCAVGALIRATHDLTGEFVIPQEVQAVVDREMQYYGMKSLAAFNDHQTTDHEQVIAVLHEIEDALQ